MGSVKSATGSLNDILIVQLIVVLKFCLCIIVSAFDLLQLPQIFCERSFAANISPHPFIVSNTDGTYTVVADMSVAVVVCQDKLSAVTGLFAVYLISSLRQHINAQWNCLRRPYLNSTKQNLARLYSAF